MDKVNYFKYFGKLILIVIFLYILIFSIQNFWQGYHSMDTAFNFLNLGMKADIGTNGKLSDLTNVYLSGVNQMSMAFIWLCLDVIVGVVIGYLFRRSESD